MMKKIFFLLGSFLLLSGIFVQAQDSTKRKTINITSSFKPVLRDAAKINFNAAPPIADTAKPRLTYNIPSQYLFLTYQPAELRPVALQADSMLYMQNDNYIKVGIGNVHQPYIKTGFSFGDGKNTLFNVFGDGYSSKGKLPFQKNNLAAVAVSGIVKTKNNLEWSGKLGFRTDGYYLYGFNPDTLKYNKEQLLQRFQNFEGNFALRNVVPTEFGLTYNPNIHVSVFTDNHTPKATESNSVLNLPLEKTIGENFAFDLGFTASLTNYKIGGNPAIQNNLYYVSPALSYHNTNLKLKAELTPSWDNGIFHLLPNLLADITTNDKRFTLQFGWIGYYDKGSYQRYASINPWLAQPVRLLNTRVEEGFAGFRGSINNHFSYAARVGLVQFWNMPLFVNDSLDGKTFPIRYEINLKSVLMHGEITYAQGEQFTATAALTINQYSPKHEMKAWGLMPLEFTTTLRWQLLKDLWIKGDLWAFDGAPYLGKDNNTHSGQGAFDLNAGIEFRVARQVNLWLQMNNIFNNQYERWHQYQAYGFNILGGVIFSFGQKTN
ncbi:MAG TPA: hypothetical protein VK543_08565 [Puia sp.]|nr:hypothetical protein [Puia sp.]